MMDVDLKSVRVVVYVHIYEVVGMILIILSSSCIRNTFLWLHSIFALLYFVITVLCMAHHSSRLEYREDEKVGEQL